MRQLARETIQHTGSTREKYNQKFLLARIGNATNLVVEHNHDIDKISFNNAAQAVKKIIKSALKQE